MVAFVFDPLYHSILVFLSALLPGIAIGWPLLKKSHFSATEKLFVSFFLGLFAVPTLLFLEGLVGLPFSLFLIFINAFLLLAAGAFWGIRNGAFSFSAPKISLGEVGFDLETAKKVVPPLLLILAALLAFWIRLQPFSPIYSELDPYFYIYGTGQIIREGMVPLTDDTAWWPEFQGTHRTSPLKMYLEAQWYALYTGGGEYNNYLLFTTSSWLPPISAAMLAFGAYLLVSSIYGRKYGVFAAFLMAFLPSTIFKMSAGVNEAAPVGMMMLFMAMGTFAWALYKKDEAARILAAFAFFVTVAASNFQSVVALPLAGIMVLQAIDYFWRGKPNLDFLLTCAHAFAGLLAGSLLAYTLYSANGLNSIVSGPVMMAFGGLAFAAAGYALLQNKNLEKKRNAIAAAFAVACLLLFFFSPIGALVKTQVKDYLGAVEYKTALEKTIAEQNLAGSTFEGEGGFLAIVPKGQVQEGAKDPAVIAMNVVYSALGAICAPFTFAGNLMLKLADGSFNLLLGTSIATSSKTDSLLFVFLVSSVAGLAVRHFTRKGEARETASVMLLVLMITLPILYVGMNKIKFSVYAGLMIAVVAATGMAEIETFARWIAGKIKSGNAQKYVSIAFAALLLLVVYAEAAGPVGYGKMILGKSFEPRYQDDPTGMAPKAAKLCEDLRARGIRYDQIAPLCLAGADPAFPSTIDSQFNSDVCWMMQLTVDELLPSTQEAQRKSSEAAFGARFRCNRNAQYWVESMEWISKNLEAGDRVTSWWDYGHWTNYFGDRKTVLRNEHASRGMIGRVAHDYILGSPQDLKDSMNYFDSKYALFDVELIGGDSFGGKYGALNYLGCVHEGEATLQQGPGTSDCEFEHSPERILIPKTATPQTACVISESQQRRGVLAYSVKKSGVDLSSPVYCVGDAVLKDGQKTTATYYLEKKDSNGDLQLSKGFIRVIDDQADNAVAEMVYNELPVWPGANGTYVGGMEDAKTKFYTSNLYRGFYLENLPGFELAYKSRNGEIKIYKMKDFVGNKEGKIDPVEAARQN